MLPQIEESYANVMRFLIERYGDEFDKVNVETGLDSEDERDER